MYTSRLVEKQPLQPIQMTFFNQFSYKIKFLKVQEENTYGTFEIPSKESVPFNGHTYMKFDMDISAVTISKGASDSTKPLGSWRAGLESPLSIGDSDGMKNLTAAIVYRIFTVVASIFVVVNIDQSLIYPFLISNHHLLSKMQQHPRATLVTVLI